ncbi:peptidoglycan-binding domain-containing protein [Terasakiella pusilla]|uniref:peptidoglycan-binding domain-containing protein n=1 Tax=Terasakiella pusilla TaxID=64973 RepID=UPI003AA9DB74
MGIFDGLNGIFGIDNTISQSANTQPDDVLKTKTALAQTGHYKVPDFGITEIPDMGMINGLKGFQQDNGLKVDGVMKPGGPTEAKLGKTLAKQGNGNMDLHEQTKSKMPKIDPLTGAEEVKMPKLKMPTKAQWDQVAKIQKPKQTPWFQSPSIQPVADEAHSANTRTMDGLLQYSVNGSLPHLYADSIKKDGDKAVNEYANFMQQLNDRKTDRVETFHQEVMNRLPQFHKQKFTALAETNYSQPTAAAMRVENVDDEKTVHGHSYDIRDQENPERTWNPEQEKRDREEYARKHTDEMEERRLDRIEKNLRTGSKIGRAFGLDDAADHLDQFLDGDGADRTVHRDDARKNPFIRRAEEENRRNFENNTFLAQPSKSDDPSQRRRKDEQNNRMRNLKNGESMYIDPNDQWNQDQTNP